MEKLIATDKKPVQHTPEWCGYPDAYEAGIMGCWSLLYKLIYSEDDCKKCGLYLNREQENE